MSDIPDDFEVIRDELTPEDLEKLKSVKLAQDFARDHRIPCTGRPDQLECDQWPYMLLVLHGQAFGVVCMDCIQPVIGAVFRDGHGSLRTESFTDMDPETVQGFAEDRRRRHGEDGRFYFPPSPNLRGTHPLKALVDQNGGAPHLAGCDAILTASDIVAGITRKPCNCGARRP